jgi:hypothetical protein
MDGSIMSLLVVAWVFLAWFTHVVVCIKSASWIFLLAGAVFFPVGCLHGTGVWLGVF